ncbi:site-2 protease family protein [uncultured Paludibaculum sp.]|uniref:site-2 protease family protein n=1 Tax=uncultured Paludibaculum sp. TaxID=1765020 RepID=UPI002AAAE3D0|nr:site-2 protease family protein [uncultured Paludibaculum sp.]
MDDKTPSSANDGRAPGSVGLFRLFGVPVRFHFTFWLLVVWLIFLGAEGKQSPVGTAVYVFGLFASVLLHEVGHALVARRFGIQTTEIVMLPLGGLSKLARQLTPSEEFWVALAGPMVNFVLGAALLGWTFASGGTVELSHWRAATDANLAGRLAVTNLILAFFNLLPAFPMDGGRVMRSLLAAKRPIEDATRITARIGMVVAAAMALYGLLNSNFVLIFFAFIVYVGATQEVMATSAQALMKGATVVEAMITDFRTLQHGDSIRDAADLLLATSQQDFPVLSGGETIGLLNRTNLLKAMAAEGPDAYVAGVMDRAFARLSPDMMLSDAALLMGQSGDCALVFEREKLVGLLTGENLSEFLVLRKIRQARGSGPGPDAGNE